MPQPLREAFLARARTITVGRKQSIIAEGTDTSDVFLVVAGRCQFSLVSPNGREVVLRDMGPNELFGELSAIDGGARSTNVTALEAGKLAHMSAAEFTQYLIDVPRAGLWIARQLAQRIRSLTDRAFELATLPVASRVQAEVLRVAREAAAPGEDSVLLQPMPTHADLAARIGTSREAVSRELGLLAQEGVLTQSGRKLEVPSLAALQALHDRMMR